MIRLTTAPVRLRSQQLARLLSDKSDKSDKFSKTPQNEVEPAKTPKEKQKKLSVKPISSSRLNELLASMSTDSDLTIVKTVVAPKPKQKEEKKAKKSDDKPENIVDAAKKVATELGGDTKQTELELLAKLLKRDTGDHSDLKLSDLISGMKVDQPDQSSQNRSRSNYVRENMSQRRTAGAPDERYSNQQQDYQQTRPRFSKRYTNETQSSKISGGSVKLFEDKPLGIFINATDLQDSPDILETWSMLQARELKLAVTHPPSNHFQKMALWTEQGKLWKFPIDNEQGLDDESKIYFTEHIFLDKHLESWCPPKGPIRHFMELVCVGLSKNPYYTVQQKIDHIQWFQQYFDEKKEILEKTIIEDKVNVDAAATTPVELR